MGRDGGGGGGRERRGVERGGLEKDKIVMVSYIIFRPVSIHFINIGKGLSA